MIVVKEDNAKPSHRNCKNNDGKLLEKSQKQSFKKSEEMKDHCLLNKMNEDPPQLNYKITETSNTNSQGQPTTSKYCISYFLFHK